MGKLGNIFKDDVFAIGLNLISVFIVLLFGVNYFKAVENYTLVLPISLFILGVFLAWFRHGTFLLPGLIGVFACCTAFDLHINTIFQLSLHNPEAPTLDFAVGSILGMLLFRRPLNSTRTFDRIAVLFIIMLLMSSVLGTMRALSGDGDVFTLKGFLFGVLNFRKLSWHDAYFSWRPLLSLSLFAVYTRQLLARTELDLNNFNRLFVVPLIWASVLVAMYGIIQRLLGVGFLQVAANRGINATFPDVHAYSAFAMIGLVASVYLLAERKDKRILAGAGISLNLLGLLLSQSKFQIMVAVPFLGAVCYYYWIKNWSWRVRVLFFSFFAVLAAVITFVVLTLIYHHNGIRVTDLANIDYVTFNKMLSLRPEQWLFAWKIITEYPLEGVGNGLYNHLSSLRFYSTTPYGIRSHGQNAHNYFLQLTSEIGLVGLIITAMLLIIPRNRSYSAPMVMILALLSSNIFSHSLLVPDFLMILAAMTAAHHAIAGPSSYLNLLKDRFWWGALGLVILLYGVIILPRPIFNAPFLHGSHCNVNHLYDDGWTAGIIVESERHKLPEKFTVKTDRGGTHRHPVIVDFGRYDVREGFQQMGQIVLNSRDPQIVPFPSGVKRRYVRTKDCFSPAAHRSFGDRRLLGVKLDEIQQ